MATETSQPYQATAERTVTATVNEQPVILTGPRLTGRQIKEATIAQGIPIGLDFVLSEEIAKGKTKIVGDDDVVTVNKNSVFHAVANDDNS